jgi:RHS repeat-associated protein
MAYSYSRGKIYGAGLKDREDNLIYLLAFHIPTHEEFKKHSKNKTHPIISIDIDERRKINYTFKLYHGRKGNDVNSNRMVLIKAERSTGEEIETPSSSWRFSSKRHDPESGFIYFGERYYDPGMGRWITRDSLGTADGPNPYAHVKNNPVNSIDPTGLFCVALMTNTSPISSTI